MKTIYTTHNFAKRLVMVLAVGLMAVNAWGATTYKLTQITSSSGLENGKKYVFIELYNETEYVLDGSITSKYLNSVTSYSSTGLAGTESYVWTLATTTGGFYLKNQSGKYLRHNVDKTEMSWGDDTSASNIIWTFNFYSDNTTYIKNTSGNRYLEDTGYGYRAYIESDPTDMYSYYYVYVLEEECSNSVTISKGTQTNCTFTLSKSGSQASCDGVSTTVTVSPSTGYGSPSVTQSGASAAPSITGSGNNWTVSYGNNTTGISTINVSCSANNYTVTLDDDGGSGGSGSKTVTYNANTNLTTNVAVPTKAHHDFGGYYTAKDGGGTQLINADGSWKASVATYTDESKNWIKADGVTLYAKWTEHDLTNYRTSCCTELGTIDGEATLTQGGNSVTISGWSDVSNVGTYTVKLYKKNGASWDLVSGTTSGGSAGAQGTRTGIMSGSKSVTYTGLEVESEY